MARHGGTDAARGPSERTRIGRTAAAATNVLFAPIWLILWLQHRAQSQERQDPEDPGWFVKDPINGPGYDPTYEPLQEILPEAQIPAVRKEPRRTVEELRDWFDQDG